MTNRSSAILCCLLTLVATLFFLYSPIERWPENQALEVSAETTTVKAKEEQSPSIQSVSDNSSAIDAIQGTATDESDKVVLPPTPTLLSRTPAIFPWQASALNIPNGRVDLTFTVTVYGTVENIVVRESSNEAFQAAAVDALSQYLFEPALQDGVPIQTANMMERINFFEAGPDPNLDMMADMPTALPLTRPNPKFPDSAIEAGLKEGYVIMELTLDAGGVVENASVIESSSESFEANAIQATLKNRYLPHMVNGEAQRTEGMRYRIDFVAPKNEPEQVQREALASSG